MTEQIKKLMGKLERNNMQPFYAENSAEAVDIVRGLLKKGDVISCGGSETLKESKVMDLMCSGDYEFLDRSLAKTPDEIREVYVRTFGADVFLTSCNAITEQGWLYNVDGNSNRIAAIAYGPKSVIVVAGVNKIVKDLQEAELRVKKTASPKNTVRLSKDTYCAKTGECVSLANEDYQVCDGCASDDRICCNYLISSVQRHKNRIKVIIVNENLGY